MTKVSRHKSAADAWANTDSSIRSFQLYKYETIYKRVTAIATKRLGYLWTEREEILNKRQYIYDKAKITACIDCLSRRYFYSIGSIVNSFSISMNIRNTNMIPCITSDSWKQQVYLNCILPKSIMIYIVGGYLHFMKPIIVRIWLGNVTYYDPVFCVYILGL